MPVFDTPNTQETYTPGDVQYVGIRVRGGVGGNGEDGSTTNGGEGGPAGEVIGEWFYPPEEQLAIIVGESGEDGNDGGAGGQNPLYDAGDGGSSSTSGVGDGGGGGSFSAIQLPDGSYLVLTEGGGGAGGGAANSEFVTENGQGGGGGARGGAGAGSGQDASGSGSGGDGGPGGSTDGSPGADGNPGGTVVHSDLDEATTGTSKQGPVVAIGPGVLAPTLSVADVSSDAIELSWSSGSHVDNLEIQRRQPGGSWSTIATVTAGSAPYTDTSVSAATEYEYRAIASNDFSSRTTNTVSATTPLSAPTDVEAIATDPTTVELTWTLQSTTESGVRIYQSVDGGASWTQAADLDAGAESATVQDLRNGQQYLFTVEVYSSDTAAESEPDDAETDLPPLAVADITPIDASVEDELTIPNPSVTNNGVYRVRYRESGTDAWTDWGTVAHDGGDVTITGLKDGEQYDLSVRAETDDVVGTWTTVSEITLLPAPAAVTIADRVDTLLVSFDDRADNEIQHRLERAVGENGWETVATVDPNIETLEDPDPEWYRLADYRVVAETEHTTSASSAVTAIPVKAEQFYAELERGDSALVVPPSELVSIGEITLEHTTPSAFILEVAPSATDYQDYCLGDARLFYGDQRFFSGRLDSASETRGTTTLKGEGRLVELEADTTVTTYQRLPAQEAIRDYIQNVPGDWTVHDPFARTVSDGAEVHDSAVDTLSSIVANADDDPVVIDGQQVRLAQTCWFAEAESADSIAGDVINAAAVDPSFSGDEAVRLSSADHLLELEFAPEYRVSGEDLDIDIRFDLVEFSGTLEARLDGTTVFDVSYPEGQTATTDIEWGAGRFSTVELDDLAAGTDHTLTLAIGDWYNGAVRVDCFAAFDSGDRFDHGQAVFDYGFDNTVVDGTLEGPGLYPASFPIEIEPDERIWHIAAAGLETTIDDVSGNQQLRLSPTGSDGEFVALEGAETFSADFDDAGVYGTEIHAEIVLSRYTVDSTTTPTTGDAGQVCSSIRLTTTTDDLPLIDEFVTDGDTWLANLQNLHEEASARFVVDQQADGLVVESFRTGDPSMVQPDGWTTAGQDSVETDRVTGDYFNRIRSYPDDPNAEFGPVTLIDSDEVDRVEEEITVSRTFDVDTPDGLRKEARRALREGVVGDEFSGRISILPTDAKPGYPYEPDEFGGELTNAEQVTVTIADGEASGQISFGSRRDLVAQIQQRTRDN